MKKPNFVLSVQDSMHPRIYIHLLLKQEQKFKPSPPAVLKGPRRLCFVLGAAGTRMTILS